MVFVPGVPTILIMCTGNMCRSPMAEALMAHHAKNLGVALNIFSRGFAAPVGRPPHPFALEVAERNGVPIDSSKRASLVSSVDINAASLILVMDAGHMKEMRQRFPTATGKTFLLGRWINAEIEDPINQPIDAFEKAWGLCDEGVNSWIKSLLDAGLCSPNQASVA